MSSVATIAEVAAHAGVSNATVSRALRGMPGVTEATRQRVLASARRLGYVVTPLSRHRLGRAVSRVAVVLPRVDTWFFARCLEALSAELTALGCLVELHVARDLEGRRQHVLRSLGEAGRLAGVVVVGMTLRDAERAALAALRCPVVGLHADVGSLPAVHADDEGMARWAVGHLVALGHRRIAMVTSAAGAPVAHAVPLARTRGYRAGLAAAGLTHRTELEVCGGDSAVGSQEATARLFVGRHAPTAVFVHTDEMAFGVLAGLSAAGLAVPADVSVISIDDHPLAPAFGLTTVAQDVGAQAARVAGALVQASVAPPDEPWTPLPVVPEIASHLVIRTTTAPPGPRRPRRPRQPRQRSGVPSEVVPS